MRVAFVKSYFDVSGPWASVKYGEPLAPVWPSKATFLSPTKALKADWYMLREAVVSFYLFSSWNDCQEIITKYAKGRDHSFPYEDYDVVISSNPIIMPPRTSKTLFAYYNPEDWDNLISDNPEDYGFDLYLDQYSSDREELSSLPQAIWFPFMQLGGMEPVKWKDDTVWVDWRTGYEHDDINGIEVANIGPMFDRERPPMGIHDPPLWGDAWSYLARLARCKYFLSFGRNRGPGQSAVEAARLGALCIGSNRLYHRLVCHPDLLCDSMQESTDKLKQLSESKSMQEEVLAYQEEAVNEHFYRRPMSVLEKALNLKNLSTPLT